MSVLQGPIIFVTTGLNNTLRPLPGVAQLAALFDRQLVVLHTREKRYEEYATSQIAEALAELPPASAAPEVVVAPVKQRAASLRSIAAERGGMLAILPQRRDFVSRLLLMITDYEAMMIEGPLPLIALPRDSKVPPRVRRILFPIDLSPRSLPLLDETIELCAALRADLHLIHLFGADRLLPGELDAARQAAHSPKQIFDLDKQEMQRLAERARARQVVTVLEHAEGRAHQGILGYMGQHQIDLVVMATHGPRSQEDIWHGTTTARVIRDAQVPVIAVRA